MAIKIYKPTSPGRRASSTLSSADLTKKEPERSLLEMLPRTGGRNHQGTITVRHQGGGARRFYRLVDFDQAKLDVPATVEAIEYDPNRNARIALIKYQDGEKSYLLAPQGLAVGATVVSSQKAIEITPGNRLPLKFIPVGIAVCNVELSPGRGGTLIRSAGTAAFVASHEGALIQLKLPSGEIRLIAETCRATVGEMSAPDYKLIRWGKAGRMRRRGIRPSVRGKAMNPVDHPHGGGEGNQPIGLVHPKTPWGRPALGVKTRKEGKYSDKFIVKRRK